MAFAPRLAARVIHKNPSHKPGGERVEVLAIFKAKTALPDQFEEELIDDARRLHEMFRPLAAEQSAGNPAQFRIDELKKPVQSIRLACSPLAEENGNLTMLAFIVRQNDTFLLRSGSEPRLKFTPA